MRTRAFIIKKQNTNEYDQLITCYTQEFGKLTAVAKSILKKSSLQSMHLDIFNLVEFELIDGRALPIIASAHSEKTYPQIKKSLEAVAVTSFFFDLIDKIVFDNERDDNLWNLLESTLDQIDASRNDQLLDLLRANQLKFLNVSGYSPRVDSCGLCGARVNGDNYYDHEWALNIDLGGLICRNCYLLTNHGLLLREGDLRVLRDDGGAMGVLSKSSLDLIFESVTGKKLNSLKYIYQVFNRS